MVRSSFGWTGLPGGAATAWLTCWIATVADGPALASDGEKEEGKRGRALRDGFYSREDGGGIPCSRRRLHARRDGEQVVVARSQR
jgi:hypothetical protein